MSYEMYKLIHVLSIILFVAMVVRFFTSKDLLKWQKGLLHGSGFFILVGGMGLLARLGVSHTEGWPLWVKIKLAIWLIMFPVYAIMSKKLVAKGWAMWPVGLAILVSTAAYFAIFKI